MPALIGQKKITTLEISFGVVLFQGFLPLHHPSVTCIAVPPPGEPARCANLSQIRPRLPNKKGQELFKSPDLFLLQSLCYGRIAGQLLGATLSVHTMRPWMAGLIGVFVVI